jgi:HAD superfamily hydrolase (TIGR01509 family)
MLKALVFDMDGTVSDTDPFHIKAFARMLAPRGVTIDVDFYREQISGKSNDEIGRLLLPEASSAEQVTFAEEKEALYRELSAAGLQPAPGLIDLLDWAGRQDLATALVTNAPQANVGHTLTALAMTERFAIQIAGGDVPRGKPDPLPYKTALARLGVEPHEALAFEDSLPGVQSAVAAGIPTVGVTTGQSEAALLDAGASLAISDFTDPRLLRLLERTLTN